MLHNNRQLTYTDMLVLACVQNAVKHLRELTHKYDVYASKAHGSEGQVGSEDSAHSMRLTGAKNIHYY